MTYTEFVNRFLVALYIEVDGNPSAMVNVNRIVEKYQLSIKHDFWIDNLLGEIKANGLGWTEAQSEPSQLTGIGITLQGVRTAEGYLPIYGDELFENGRAFEQRLASTSAEVVLAHDVVDSTLRNELSREGNLKQEEIKRVQKALIAIEDTLGKSSATNEQVAQARAFVAAIRALAEAPSPPADLIWQLVSKANSIAGIASFFVALMALFVSAAH